MPTVDFQRQAKAAVVVYFNDKNLGVGYELTEDQVFISWFNRMQQSWQAILTTIVPDGMVYELTYDGDKKKLSLVAYQKTDEAELTPQ